MPTASGRHGNAHTLTCSRALDCQPKQDWDYLVRYGFWCKHAYGEHINKIDFSLEELTPEQLAVFQQLRDEK